MKNSKILKSFGALTLMMIFAFFLYTCGASKKASDGNYVISKNAVSYEKDISPVMTRSCSPCHFPDEGKKKYLDTYAAVKENIEDILIRVQKPVDEKGYMPWKSKKPALSDEEIDKLKMWAGQNFPK